MTFLDLHTPGDPLLMPNAWDAGSAKLLASLGFKAIATTSSGFAATLGRGDGDVSRDEALAHSADLVAAVDIPVSADLENLYADDTAGIADTIAGAVDAGLAGCSIEDWSGTELYALDEAVERIAAAVKAADGQLVVTARAENHLRGCEDLTDTIARLQAYEQAGADVVYAPGLTTLEDITALVSSVGVPVNVLSVPGAPTIPELAAAGVARVSVGSGFMWAAMGAVVDAANELRDHGTYGFWQGARRGAAVSLRAFRD
jgi:2-methylisocitrate lyase-like PEP mutase family enzyme